MPYASQADLTDIGLPVAALGTGVTAVTTAQITKALQDASDFADSFFRARWGQNAVPLLVWDTSVTKHVALVAAYYVMNVRGYFAESEQNKRFRDGYDDACDWFNKVQRQQAHPLVTLATGGAIGQQQPNLISSSVVNLSSGATSGNRGW